MNILILSCNTGGGHNTAAKSIKEIFDSQGDNCIIKDALAFGSKTASDLVCDSYVEIVKNNPKLFGNIYELGKRAGVSFSSQNNKVRSPIYIVNTFYAKSLAKFITSENIEAVICTHFFPAMALTHLRKHEKIEVPFYFVATDYSCSPMLEETNPDKIFVPHKDCLHFFTQRGINTNKLIVSGIPVSQNFTLHKDKTEARTELKLPVNKKILLVMTGSMGFGDTEKMTQDILEQTDENTCIVVIAGNNQELKESLENNLSSYINTENQRLFVQGYTDQVYLYMSACDIFLSKPGGLSSTEALVKCIPIIHTAPIPGCESENVDFFTKHHLSICATNTKDAGIQSVRLLKDDFLRNQIYEAQKYYKYQNSAKTIADSVKKHITG